jgi:alkylation response protein AidB-like acyl-CoA dehydrogenase
MDFALTDEQRLWQETVHDFCEKEIRPSAAALDAEARFNHEAVPKLAALGLLGLGIPEEFGGAGTEALTAALAIEELGWACGGTGLSVAAHGGLCAASITAFGTDEQKRRWLPDLADGEHGLGSLALTEPGAGSDLAGGVQTRAVLDGDTWVVTGHKAWITNASLAPLIVCLCRTDPDAGSRALSMIVVPTDAEGVHVHPHEKKMGMRASPTHAIDFEDVRVPADHLLGKRGRGLHQTLKILDGGRIGIGALALGLGRAAMEAAVRYASERQAFGGPLASHQAVQFMLADAATRLDAARLLVHRAAWLEDLGRPCTREAAMGKLQATETAERVCRDAIQIFGGYGYSSEYPVERMYRDARLLTIGEGTSEVQRMVIARGLLDLA